MIGRLTIGLALILIALAGISASGDEFRAFLVDAWDWGSGAAIANPTATQQTVDHARSCNTNVVVIEVRKRADAYYTSAIEPVGTNLSPAPGYDCLADMISKAHAAGLEVHPWVVTYRVWTTPSGPPHTTPEHIWYLHPDWLNCNSSGSTMWTDGTGVAFNLDPGIPAVEDYLIGVFMDIVLRYDIDGFLLDYIRYYGTEWGYNPTAVARFNAEYGRTGRPSTTDPVWQQWRRDQVSNLVKRLYLEIKAVKPRVKLGAAVGHTAATARSGILQDWDRWMSDHYIDYVSPMNYTTDNAVFHSESIDSAGRAYGHHVYIGQSTERNTIANTIWQINDARAAGSLGAAFYSYAHCNVGTPDPEGFKNALLAGPYSTPAAVPDMPWLTAPSKGYLKGFIRDAGGAAVYPATVTITGQAASTKNSGAGFYGCSEIAPGLHGVRVESPGYLTVVQTVTIGAGQVACLDFALQRDPTPPVITNLRAQDIQATHARIAWNTNEPSASQSDYGLSANYGSTTIEDAARVTSHSVQLVGLGPLTTYHFRARSRDAAGNVAQSSDCTFTTAGSDQTPDIIIDNLDGGFSTSGAWWPGTMTTGMYGADYIYTTTLDPARSAVFRPNILTAGSYDVYIWYTQGGNRSTQAKWRVCCDGGMQEFSVSEQINGSQWNLLAADKPFAPWTSNSVGTYSDTGDTSSMVVIADAVRFVYKGPAAYDPDAIAPSVADAKGRADGLAAVLLGKVVSAAYADHYYICDSTKTPVSGLRVNGPPPAEGSIVNVSGVMDTINGERVLLAP